MLLLQIQGPCGPRWSFARKQRDAQGRLFKLLIHSIGPEAGPYKGPHSRHRDCPFPKIVGIAHMQPIAAATSRDTIITITRGAFMSSNAPHAHSRVAQ